MVSRNRGFWLSYRAWPATLLLAAVATVGACSGDDDVITDDPEGGNIDSGRDARADAKSDVVGDVTTDRSVDTGVDGSIGNGRDGAADGDGGAAVLVDGSMALDADASARADTGDSSDTSTDGDARAQGADAPADVDSGSVEAAVDAAHEAEAAVVRPIIAIENYQRAIDSAWCQKMAGCCGTNFDTSACVSYWDANFGAEYLGVYLQQYAGNFTGVNAVFDQTQAYACLDLLASLPCGSVDGATKRRITSTCLAAIQGTGAGSCKTSMECSAGKFCDVPFGGSSGTCAALKAEGQPCDDPAFNGDRCSYLGSGVPALYCDPLGSKKSDAGVGAGVCRAGQATLSSCFSNQSCASYVCAQANGGACADSTTFTGTFCSDFARVVDAGNGG